jgi:hypothetical protein
MTGAADILSFVCLMKEFPGDIRPILPSQPF